MDKQVKNITEKYQNDHTRLMDILIDVQEELGYIPEEAKNIMAKELGISSVDIEQTMSFYHFLSDKPVGKYTIHLNNSVTAEMAGRKDVVEEFENETGTKFNSVSEDGLIGLFDTACIGMSDQEPAALINGMVFPHLTPNKVKILINDMKAGKPVEEMITGNFGDGNNSRDDVKSTVNNNIRKTGPVLDPSYEAGQILKEKVSGMQPEEVIGLIKASNIRGRGGAGFPTGLKWDFCRKAAGDKKYIFCNADEGEPGTFKDRVIMTERPKLLLEGMAIAGYAVGADEGIIYIRHEYKYMKTFLENQIKEAEKENIIGENAGGISGFNFNVRIQFGAGAYVCGEESALLESAEGKRGEPRDRPPFPVEKGYLDKPTSVNNVETFCLAVKILDKGPQWFTSLGTKDSSGTKLLSVSGDCKMPGVYEVEWGFSVQDILDMVKAEDVQAVQIGGPSGSLIGPDEFKRTLCFSDLATGGSIIIFNNSRDLIKDVVLNFTDFFIEESCGSCSVCRAMPVLLKQKLLKILNKKGVKQDINDLSEWASIMPVNRCGLGQTAGNPITTSIKNFRPLYEKRIQSTLEYDSGFDISEAIQDGAKATNREAVTH